MIRQRISPCKGCKDRCPEPNCHMTWKSYLEYLEENKKKKETVAHNKNTDILLDGFKYEMKMKTVKRLGK